jgi:phosphatidylglycerol:prolipoprotein diacylglycerol transferase
MGFELLHIYGPFAIRSYGLCIAIGTLIFLWLLQKYPRYKALNVGDKLTTLVFISIIGAIIGGRFMYAVSGEHTSSLMELCLPWNGGFSVLGSILGILIVLLPSLIITHIPVVPFLDVVAIHGALLQAIARFGCFFAGCCYGKQTISFWGVTYTDPQSLAPLGICLHPTQIYSATMLMLIFLTMYFFLQHYLNKPGQLSCMYLMLISAERFLVDFWRDERIMSVPLAPTLSFHQLIAFGIFITTTILFIFISLFNKKSYV